METHRPHPSTVAIVATIALTALSGLCCPKIATAQSDAIEDERLARELFKELIDRQVRLETQIEHLRMKWEALDISMSEVKRFEGATKDIREITAALHLLEKRTVELEQMTEANRALAQQLEIATEQLHREAGRTEGSIESVYSSLLAVVLTVVAAILLLRKQRTSRPTTTGSSK